jgi:hypothetical protein
VSTFADHQRQLNRTTAAAWQRFTTHRARVWNIIRDASVGRSERQRLRLLGAGNVNDVDLMQALLVFEVIELVDIDDEAIRRGITRQGLRSDRRIVVRGGIDFRNDPLENQSFDVVASCCVLSQLVGRAVQGAGPAYPEIASLVLSERDAHLATLVSGVVPGGAAVLVTDFVSSDTAPELLNRSVLSTVDVAALVSAGNFFTGCNPFILQRRLEALPRVASVLSKPPWIWHISSHRSYAVAAFVARTESP